MNEISESVLQAVDILVNDAVSKLEYDKTIKAEIYSIANLDSGEYKVRYAGNIFSAYASDLESKYKVGDIVYVMVPEGDFSGRKIIHSTVKSQSLSYGQMVALTNSIIEVSPTLDVLYNYNASEEYGVVAGAPPASPLSYKTIFEGDQNGYHGLFQQYSKNYELIRIKASFLTTFHSEHTQGNYGLEVQFFTKSDDIVIYQLDLSSFNGDPYSLSVYSPQSVVVKAQLGYLTGIKSIKLFEENFVYDKYVEYGLVTDRENTTTPNIFVKDIAIQFVEQKDLTDNLYYLAIGIPQGNSFTSNITSLDLVARLIYEDENILNEKNCECYWYIRDLDVVLGSEDYDKNAGVSWRRIESSTFDTITLKPEDVAYQNQYKLVTIYNENVILSAEMTIFNLLSPYNFEMVQSTVGDQIELQILNNANNEVLVGDWYLSYPDGSYLPLVDKQNRIVVTDYLLYSAVNFYCGVYSYDQSSIVGVLEHTIITSESEEDITIAYDGEDSFRYDANGDVTIEDSEKERTLQVILTWKDGVGTSYKVEWIGPDGNNISNTRYSPTQSMIENLWVDNNSILHYTIRQKYKVNYNNNTITVKIITIDEKEYIFEKEILFLKDGDQGTNGTTYIATIRPYDTSTGLKLSGLNPLIYRNNDWQNTLPLRCYVYKDGQLINNHSSYGLSYRWTGVGVTLTTGTAEDCQVASGTSAIKEGTVGAYVKAQVTINDNMNGRNYDIYCSYPIDVAIGFTDEEVKSINIDNIPSYIKYTSSGVNPSFYSNNITFLFEETDYSNNITSVTPNLLDVEPSEGLLYLKPASSFVFEDNSISLLKCEYTSSKFLYHPIMLYLDTYGNEAINGWDGTQIDVNGEGGYILAPQVGAGTKDSANRFTGVVMGQDSGQEKIGLYGYQNGVNTFGLMQDGRAYFGAKSGGGQIVIDGRHGTISGGDVLVSDAGSITPAANGMYLVLADKGVKSNQKAIGIGYNGSEENFYVTFDGKLRATEANVQGAIYANTGQIGGAARSGGWTIGPNRLYSGSGTSRVELNSDPSTSFAIWAGATSPGTAYSKDSQGIGTITSPAPFVVTRDGFLYAKNARIKGNIEADTLTANKSGTIGGWTISSNQLTANNGRVGMASSGTYAFWVNSVSGDDTKFSVTHGGKLSCTNADVEGKITADSGTIGGWTINTTSLYSGNVKLSSSGAYAFSAGSNFSVTHDGVLTCSNASISGVITADAGQIGGWTIEPGGLTSRGVGLFSFPNDYVFVAGSNFRVTSAGKLICEDAEIRGDEITMGGIFVGKSNDDPRFSDPCVAPTMDNYGNLGTPSYTWDTLYVRSINGTSTSTITGLPDKISDLESEISTLENSVSSLQRRVSALESA